MPSVAFDSEFINIFNKLCEEKDETTGQSIFKFNWEFMIFLAMVGRHKKDSCSKVDKIPTNRRVKDIKDVTFEQANKVGIVYALGIDQSKGGDILRDDDDNESWLYLEKFAQIGIEEVYSWFVEFPAMKPSDLILSKIKEIAESNISKKEFIKPNF